MLFEGIAAMILFCHQRTGRKFHRREWDEKANIWYWSWGLWNVQLSSIKVQGIAIWILSLCWINICWWFFINEKVNSQRLWNYSVLHHDSWRNCLRQIFFHVSTTFLDSKYFKRKLHNIQWKASKSRKSFLPVWFFWKEVFYVTTLQFIHNQTIPEEQRQSGGLKENQKSYFNCVLLFETKGGFAVFNARSSRTWMNKLNTWAHWRNEQTCANVFFSSM